MKTSLLLLPPRTKFARLLGQSLKPFSLTLAVTFLCQSRCRTCHIWKLYQKDKKAAKKELKARDYQPLFASLKNDLAHLAITGGEPFLKDDLEKLVALAAQTLKNLAHISITTNGFTTQAILRKTKKLLRLYPGNLSLEVSLDGRQKLHDKIRGLPGSYQKALETYLKLSRLAQQNPHLHIFFSYTISTFNVGRFKPFFQTLEKDLPISLEKISINLEHHGFLFHKRGRIRRGKNFQKALQKDISFILEKSSLPITPNLFRIGKTAFKRFYLKNLLSFVKNPQKMILPCTAGTDSYFIDPYGDIYPCIIWPQKLGNISRTNFQKFWGSKKIKDIQAEIKKGKCPICFTPCEAQIAFLSNLPLSC